MSMKQDGYYTPLIMVVDDEPNMCKVLQRVLTGEGYRVTTAPDGITALNMISEIQPDIVLLDLMMPGMNGRDVCAEMRKVCDTRIIYFTGRTDLVRLPVDSDIYGEADAFIPKPATAKQILSVIDNELDRRSNLR